MQNTWTLCSILQLLKHLKRSPSDKYIQILKITIWNVSVSSHIHIVTNDRIAPFLWINITSLCEPATHFHFCSSVSGHSDGILQRVLHKHMDVNFSPTWRHMLDPILVILLDIFENCHTVSYNLCTNLLWSTLCKYSLLSTSLSVLVMFRLFENSPSYMVRECCIRLCCASPRGFVCLPLRNVCRCLLPIIIQMAFFIVIEGFWAPHTL